MCILILILIILNIRINTVLVDGNREYTVSQIENYLFEENYDRISIVLFVKNLFNIKKTIPYVEKYTIDFKSFTKIHVQIYENPIIGYIEYNQSYVYFDKYGVVVEARKVNNKNVPRVEGLIAKNVTIGKKLLFENETLFTTLLNITQNINKHSLKVEKIKINDLNNIYIHLKSIDVFIGSKDNIEIKIQTLADILPQIEGLSGSLDLSKAREGMVNEKYYFKKNK